MACSRSRRTSRHWRLRGSSLAVPSVQALKSGELESGGLVVVFGAMALLSVGVALVGAYLIILAPFQLAGLQLDGVPLM